MRHTVKVAQAPASAIEVGDVVREPDKASWVKVTQVKERHLEDRGDFIVITGTTGHPRSTYITLRPNDLLEIQVMT